MDYSFLWTYSSKAVNWVCLTEIYDHSSMIWRRVAVTSLSLIFSDSQIANLREMNSSCEVNYTIFSSSAFLSRSNASLSEECFDLLTPSSFKRASSSAIRYLRRALFFSHSWSFCSRRLNSLKAISYSWIFLRRASASAVFALRASVSLLIYS